MTLNKHADYCVECANYDAVKGCTDSLCINGIPPTRFKPRPVNIEFVEFVEVNGVKPGECRRCFWCKVRKESTVVARNKQGEVYKASKEVFRCHINAPTFEGFPVVRPDDYCSHGIFEDVQND